MLTNCVHSVVFPHNRRVHAHAHAHARTYATASSQPGTTSASSQVLESPESESESIFACVSCRSCLPASLPGGACDVCGTPYTRRGAYIDMVKSDTMSIGSSSGSASESAGIGGVFLTLLDRLRRPPSQALFESGAVSFAYERGWRQNFARAGFPGADKEAELGLEYLGRGGVLLDVSCGSGIITRKLLRKGGFTKVIALDYSANMLIEAARREETGHEFVRIRGDVSALPFGNTVFTKVHSSAALHCWPFVQDGLREVHRVLRKGGRFFGTTFVKGSMLPRASAALPGGVRRVLDSNVAYRFFEKQELEWLCKAAGFEHVHVETVRGFAVVRCEK